MIKLRGTDCSVGNKEVLKDISMEVLECGVTLLCVPQKTHATVRGHSLRHRTRIASARRITEVEVASQAGHSKSQTVGLQQSELMQQQFWGTT